MNSLSLIKPELLEFTDEQLYVLAPYFFVIVGALLGTLACTLKSERAKWIVVSFCAISAVIGMAWSFRLLDQDSLALFNGMMVSDHYSTFFNVLFLGSALFTILASVRYLDRENLQHPEYYVLIMFSTIGMMLMASSLDLIMIFIALEIMSLCVYMLVGFRRADRKSNEAAMKYFILGGAASALMLYGIALLYGATVSTHVREILAFVQTDSTGGSMIFTLGLWLVVVGFLFKVAIVPFHTWMPDVYEGAPTPITGFMTTGLKAAAFAAFLRFFVSSGYGAGLEETIEDNIHNILWVCAVATMLWGNLVALSQTNLKRMLAYSSIAHTGYIMVGMIAGSQSAQGYGPVVLYLVSYAIMNLGAFVVLTILSLKGDSGLNLQDLSGLSKRHPWLALAMAVFMFSMAGVPPTAGFIGKYMLFYSAVQADEVLLVVISVLCSAISVFYYLRVLVYMYMRDATITPSLRVPASAGIAVVLMVLLTLQIGIMPSGIVETARRVVASL